MCHLHIDVEGYVTVNIKENFVFVRVLLVTSMNVSSGLEKASHVQFQCAGVIISEERKGAQTDAYRHILSTVFIIFDLRIRQFVN